MYRITLGNRCLTFLAKVIGTVTNLLEWLNENEENSHDKPPYLYTVLEITDQNGTELYCIF